MVDWRSRLIGDIATFFAGGPWRYGDPQFARLRFQDKTGTCSEEVIYFYSKEERRWKRGNYLVPRGSKLERVLLYSWLIGSTQVFPLEDKEITRSENISELESLLLGRFMIRIIPILILFFFGLTRHLR